MQAAAPSKPESSRRHLPRHGKKRVRVEESDEEEAPPAKQQITTHDTVERENGPRPKFPQPALVTGANFKDYQLEGVEWMVSLDKNGVSGILADEMGLGKTLHTIAFNAHLRGLGHYQPFLIVCPLSVLHNWIEEFQKFAPTIPVCMYHGTPAKCADLRRTVMRAPDASEPADEEVMIKRQPSQKGKGKKAPARKAPAPKRKAKGGPNTFQECRILIIHKCNPGFCTYIACILSCRRQFTKPQAVSRVSTLFYTSPLKFCLRISRSYHFPFELASKSLALLGLYSIAYCFLPLALQFSCHSKLRAAATPQGTYQPARKYL
ncbi:P-loop containing nucleoside triphosphate hydrolase protein [Suillus ampliporus]|nr:P-loop containing nucleoside triphosphate hydrolase protein [Suillus ampliporus]